MTLENLIGRGLQNEPTNSAEIQRFLAKIAAKLADAQQDNISMDSRFDLAYEAVLQLGLVALRLHDLRPDSKGGHHVLALQTLNTSVGYPREKLRLLDEFRRQRASGLYDGSFMPTQIELNELLSTVAELQAHVVAWIGQNRPEFK